METAYQQIENIFKPLWTRLVPIVLAVGFVMSFILDAVGIIQLGLFTWLRLVPSWLWLIVIITIVVAFPFLWAISSLRKRISQLQIALSEKDVSREHIIEQTESPDDFIFIGRIKPELIFTDTDNAIHFDIKVFNGSLAR